MLSTLFIKQMEFGPMQNFIYLVGDKETGECAVIDPAWDVAGILQAALLDNMNITKILISHGHPDHTNGVEALLNRADCRVYANKKEAEFMNWRWPGLVKLEGGDVVSVGKYDIRALHTPGHTPGSQCFLVENRLISGDTLFVDACGRVDLPGGDPEKMYESLLKLRELPDGTILLPGHNYADHPSSTMREQKKTNPYLQFPSIREFRKVVAGGLY